MKIDGYDGVEVYQIENMNWIVKHFSNPPGHPLRIVWRSKQFETRIEAEARMKKYRAACEESQ